MSQASRIDDLVLLRAACASRGLGAKKIADQLHPFAPRRAIDDWRTTVVEAIARLRAEGALPAGKGWALTEVGRARVARVLGTDHVPKTTSWRTLRDRYLVPRALGEAPHAKNRDELATASGLRAALLIREHDLPRDTPFRTKAATDALAWSALGVKTGEPFSIAAVKRHLLTRFVDGDVPPRADVVHLLAARAARTKGTGPEDLRASVVARWLDDGAMHPVADASAAAPQTKSTDPVGHAARETGAHDVASVETIAALAQAAARERDVERFGDRKAFIASVFDRLCARGAIAGVSLDGFKHQLAEANRMGLLRLARADLVEAMDADQVERSETRYLNATFHFVDAGGPQ